MLNLKIISGGQYGADLGGLIAAKEFGIPTGGFAPYKFLTEEGPNPELEKYGLTQIYGGYKERTIKNIKTSNATLIIAYDIASPGTALTIKNCKKFEKPFIVIKPTINVYDHDIDTVKSFIVSLLEQPNSDLGPLVLNIAGNRESKFPGIQQYATILLFSVLKELQKSE